MDIGSQYLQRMNSVDRPDRRIISPRTIVIDEPMYGWRCRLIEARRRRERWIRFVLVLLVTKYIRRYYRVNSSVQPQLQSGLLVAI